MLHIVFQDSGKLGYRKISTKKDVTAYLANLPQPAYTFELSEIPSFKYQDCWEFSGSNIIVNMTSARNQKKEELREVRKILFQRLDELFIEALSKEVDNTAIKARQQYLRDFLADPSIDAASTIEELDNITFSSWTEPSL